MPGAHKTHAAVKLVPEMARENHGRAVRAMRPLQPGWGGGVHRDDARQLGDGGLTAGEPV